MKRKVYRCAWCFELNELDIDVTEGRDQQFTEDCQVCCRPNEIHVKVDEDTLEIEVTAEAEG